VSTIRLTAAQALVRYLASQYCELDGAEVRLFAAVWAIFGHGNVAALGEALYAHRDVLPTFRAHNEQAMTHAAIAFAKASRRPAVSTRPEVQSARAVYETAVDMRDGRR
jgi:3D-(3,5/4)-trihydroxycyclohexane-1,2-dione acylhydrolase (decyclizing)